MRLISVYCLTLAMASFVALPPAAQNASLLDGALRQGRNCLSAIDKTDALLDEIADEAGTRRAMQELDMARNMMGQLDYKGCATYIDNAMRALKARRTGGVERP